MTLEYAAGSRNFLNGQTCLILQTRHVYLRQQLLLILYMYIASSYFALIAVRKKYWEY